MGFSKLTKLYVINVCFMDDCVDEGWGGGGEGVGRSGCGRCFVLVFARMRPCDLIEYNKLQFLKLLFVYLRNLGVLKNSFKWAFYIESELVGFWRLRGKPECAVKNLSKQGREPTTIST